MTSADSRILGRPPGFWALGLILAGTLLRLLLVATGQLNLVQDECQYWDWSRHLQWSYYSKGPLIAWIILLGTKLFGPTELGVRFGAIAISAASQAVLYLGLARLWARPRLALAALLVANTMPAFIASGVFMTTDNPLLFCWFAASFALYAAADPERGPGQRRAALVALALALAFGTLAKYLMLAFLPLALVYGHVQHRRGRLPPGFVPGFFSAMAAGVALGFLPILLWNLQNDFVGFKHVGMLVGVAGDKAARLIRFDRFPEYIGGQLALVTPWWLGLMLLGGWRAIRSALGRISGDLLSRDQNLLLSLLFWPVWLFILLWSFHTKILANWPSVSYVGGIVLAGAALLRLGDARPRLARSLGALGLATFVLMHAITFLPLPDRINPTLRVKGWEDLGTSVAELTRALPDPGRVFVFSDLYDLSAALAFYTPGQPRTYCAWLDRRMNQYDLWPGPQDKAGFDAVYVRKEFKDKPTRGVPEMFARIGPPIHVQTYFNGAPARKFTLFACYGYNGTWPRPDTGQF